MEGAQAAGEFDPLINELIEHPVQAQEGDSPRRQAVARAVKAWTDQLVDRSARNNLLFFRDQRSGTLDITHSVPRLVFDVLAGRSRSLLALVGEDEDARADALRRAKAIHKKAQAIYEERGIHTLHFACGLATWENQHGSAVPAAPVLLAPVTLTARGAAQNDFELAVTGDLEVNPTLLNALATEFDCRCDPEELLSSAGIDGPIDTPEELQHAFAWLSEHARAVPGFAVSDKLSLGNFSYAKLPMVRDLQSSLDALAQHDLVAALAGDANAQQAIRDRRTDVDPSLPDYTPPADEFLVLDADSSQNYAINKVLAGQDLVIKGPPGTGKSQTISNLIAGLVARGQTVLFVAEKRAAIDAVLKRLERVGLDDLVLDLHGGVSGKRQVAQSLAAALKTNATIPQTNLEREQRTLEARRAALNAWGEALHAQRAPWGISLFEAQQRLLGLGKDAASTLRLRGDRVRRMTSEVYERSREALREYLGLGGLRAAGSTPWAGANISERAEAERARDVVDELCSGVFDATLDALEQASGLPLPDTLGGWSERLELWRGVNVSLATFRPELFEQPLRTLSDQLAPLGGGAGARLSASLTDGGYRSARKFARSLLRDGVKLGNQDLYAALEAAASQQERWGDRPVATPDLDGLSERYASLTSQLGDIAGLLGVRPLEGSRAEVSDWLARLRADTVTLGRLPVLHHLRDQLHGAGFAELLDELTARQLDPETSLEVLDHVVLASIVDEVRMSDLRVSGFDGDQHERTVAEFRDADRKHVACSAQRVRRLAAERTIRVEDESPDQATLIRKEANRKSRHRPVRDNFRDAPQVMTALKPCWVMSPLVVSQVLPNDKPYFDVVIFDEASQVRPAEAIPAIARGRRVVVAGDEKQLPPTDFFSGPTISSDDDDEPALSATSTDFESILDTLLFLVDWDMLSWHYRSEDERLIAFSNAHLYGRSMLTFPGVSGPQCLRHELVPWDPNQLVNEDSANAEVLRVVELILEHAETRPDESLGVIAMGIKHADRVDAALRAALRDRHDLDEFFDENRPERFFVKNLERVQGDERDAIVLTVGYGKAADGRMLYRFGPLNVEGGERRLNVAVTRARRRMTVVSSFSALDMDPARTTARGTDLLRRYIAYAESNGGQLDRDGAAALELNPFELDIRDALEREGIPLLCQYGVGGYRLDFAAQHPEQPGRLVLAIEADGAAYHSAQTARDRDRLRQEQLERLGWRFHRIWSQDWFSNRAREIEKVVLAYRNAVEAEEAGIHDEPDSTADADPSLAIGAPQRDPRPEVYPWGQIDQFRDHELVAIVRWIESDTLLRNREELLDEAIRELGFKRRGSRIVARLEAAIDAARNGTSTGVRGVDDVNGDRNGAPAAARRSGSIQWCDVEVVGESYHRDALSAILRSHGIGTNHGRVRFSVRATLVPRPSNPYDPNAVEVHVDGRHVAHLARPEAARYQSSILELNRRGLHVTADAQIVGYSHANVGVFLRLPLPEQLGLMP
jgi:very-short-patch-repair endonuclease